ncbi:MAG: SCO family protein [Bacteroidia bacterium]|nr:SCO family protein [Bacteroidia bacterium]
MKKSTAGILIGVLAALLLTGLFFYKRAEDAPIRYLPYFGEKKPVPGDTVYHSIPDFSFVNQDGKTITKENVRGKIYVADYFFTTCKSICPIMKKQMNRVYKNFLNDSEVVFLSHTVDPETDSVQTMKEFAARFNANSKKWMFLTGDKKSLYDLARKGYLIEASEGDGGAEDFIHTQNFALVDKEFHIRGYYDGTDSADVNRLIIEIDLLKKEYKAKRN